jgi:hypothetical protein
MYKYTLGQRLVLKRSHFLLEVVTVSGYCPETLDLPQLVLTCGSWNKVLGDRQLFVETPCSMHLNCQSVLIAILGLREAFPICRARAFITTYSGTDSKKGRQDHLDSELECPRLIDHCLQGL